MIDGYKVLEDFAIKNNYSVKKCKHYNANIGQLSELYISFNKKKYRLFIHACKSVIEILFRDNRMNNKLVFSINNRDIVMGFNISAKIPGFKYKIYHCNLTSYKEINDWLSNKEILSHIKDLAIVKNESIHIYGNGLSFISKPNREINITLQILIRILKLIPQNTILLKSGEVIVDGLTFNPDNLPDKFKPLTQLIEKWSKLDDLQRAEIIESISFRKKQELISSVEPLINEINSYLDSFGKSKISNEAILLGNLAELVTELKVANA